MLIIMLSCEYIFSPFLFFLSPSLPLFFSLPLSFFYSLLHSVRGLCREVANPFSTEFQDPTEENFIKARSAIEISDSLKRKREREWEPTRRGLMPRRCNADNPALLISRSNLPGTCSVITSRRRITFLARISYEIIGGRLYSRLYRALMRIYKYIWPHRINMVQKTEEKRITERYCVLYNLILSYLYDICFYKGNLKKTLS